MKTKDIQMRDPFILKENHRYYLFGSTDPDIWEADGVGFDVYVSDNLADWDGPHVAFSPPEGFWAQRNFWAPEVHRYKDRYYMFATFKSDSMNRGVQILVSQTPEGPYREWSDKSVTPRRWACLDGTLYVDEAEQPWMIFCREWEMIQDGEMYAVRLSPDLKTAAAEPVFLFRASDAAWSSPMDGYDNCYVTDGPFVYKNKRGELTLLWSTVSGMNYVIGQAKTKNGILGPWIQNPSSIYDGDGGHGMVFKTYEGQLLLTIHTPNNTPDERPIFLLCDEDTDGYLYVRDNN